MGPSAILPGTQNYKTISSPSPAETVEEDLSICGPAGTVALIHFDLWHRASENTSDKNRHMLKFQFARATRHTEPSWNHKSRVWSPGISDPQPAVTQDVWAWMCGEAAGGDGRTKSRISGLAARLESEDESDRLSAAYELASCGKEGVPALVLALRSQSIETIGETEAKTPDNAHGTNPTPSPSALALSSVGQDAVPVLVEMLKDENWWVRAVTANVLYRIGPDARDAFSDLIVAARDPHWWVRRNVLEAIAEICDPARGTTILMTDALADEDYRVRRSACLGIARWGAGDSDTEQALSVVLMDENRYNRFYAAHALRRIGTPGAQSILFDELFTSRWCPITTKDDRF